MGKNEKKYEVGIKLIADHVVESFPGKGDGHSPIGNERTIQRHLEKGTIPSEPRKKGQPYVTHVNSIDALGNPKCDLFGVKQIAKFTGYGFRQTKAHIKSGWFPVDRPVTGGVWSCQSSLSKKKKK